MPRARLNKSSVAHLAPEERDVFLWDTELRGFGVKCTPSGHKVFVVQYRPAGGRRSLAKRMTLGTVHELSVEDARKQARIVLGAVAQGQNPSADRRAQREAETVAEVLPLYFAELEAHAKPRTVAEWRRIWEKHLTPAMGTVRVVEVSEPLLRRLHLSMKDTPVMANRTIGAARAFLEWCEGHKLRPRGSNPARAVRLYPEQAREYFLKGDELARLGKALEVAATKGLPPAERHRGKPRSAQTAKHRPKSADEPRPASPFGVAAIRFLAVSGMREQEALTLRWDDIDFERGGVILRDTKTGRSIRPLGEPALDLLRDLPVLDDNPHVFPGRKPGAPLTEVKRLWYAVLEAAGLTGKVRLHDLRHTVASVAGEGGATLPQIGAVLGHKSMKSTMRYLHLADATRKAVADRTAKDVAAAMRGQKTAVTPLRRPAKRGRG